MVVTGISELLDAGTIPHPFTLSTPNNFTKPLPGTQPKHRILTFLENLKRKCTGKLGSNNSALSKTIDKLLEETETAIAGWKALKEGKSPADVRRKEEKTEEVLKVPIMLLHPALVANKPVPFIGMAVWSTSADKSSDFDVFDGVFLKISKKRNIWKLIRSRRW